jgi:hypothetical protein
MFYGLWLRAAKCLYIEHYVWLLRCWWQFIIGRATSHVHGSGTALLMGMHAWLLLYWLSFCRERYEAGLAAVFMATAEPS